MVRCCGPGDWGVTSMKRRLLTRLSLLLSRYSSSYTTIDLESNTRCSLTRSNLVEKLDALRQEVPSFEELAPLDEEGSDGERTPATAAPGPGGASGGMWSAKIAALLDEEEDDKWGAADYFLTLSTLLNCTAPCNTLVFGLSWDASLILEANVLGRTIFLEDDTKWAGIVRRKVPCANTYSVVYSTKLRDWPVYEDPVSHSRLDMTLPLDVVTTPWDLIIVQGPSGDPTRLGAWENPGRMQSIYTASRLASRYFQFPARNSAVSVVVFDTDRLVENRFSDRFLGKENLAMAKGTTRLYRLHENFAQALAAGETGEEGEST